MAKSILHHTDLNGQEPPEEFIFTFSLFEPYDYLETVIGDNGDIPFLGEPMPPTDDTPEARYGLEAREVRQCLTTT